MLRKITFLMNATMFACAGALAVDTVAPRQTAAFAQKLLPPVLLASLSPGLSAPAASAPSSGPAKSGLPLPLVQSNALAPSAASTPVGNAMVAPIVRRRPGAGSALADTAPVKRPAVTGVAKADAAKGGDINTRVVKTAAITPNKAVRTAAVAPAPAASKKPIDLSGRSALGAAPRSGKCNAGLKYDAKLLKCVTGAPKTASRSKPVKVVKAAPPSG